MRDDVIARETLQYARTGYYAMRPPSGGAEARCMLLALHGWGQSARWFLRQFNALGALPIHTAAPQGPHQFYLDVGAKKVGFNWLTAFEKDDNIADANRFFDAVVAEAERRASTGLPLYVLGFSQGSSMAWRYALHAGSRISGVISCCSDLPADVALRLPEMPPWRTLLVYGTDDAIVPQESIEAAQKSLRGLQWAHDVLEFEGGHELNAETIHEIGQWVAGELPD
jgi:predicted esterase